MHPKAALFIDSISEAQAIKVISLPPVVVLYGTVFEEL